MGKAYKLEERKNKNWTEQSKQTYCVVQENSVCKKKSNSSSVAPCLRDARCRICMCFFLFLFHFIFYYVHGFFLLLFVSSFLQPLIFFSPPRSTLFILTSDISKLLLMLCFLGILLTFSISNAYTNKQSQRVEKKITKICFFFVRIYIFFNPAYVLVLSTKQIIEPKRSICVSSAVLSSLLFFRGWGL